MSTARDIIMANKLKEGVQDALIYLRLLEGAKLAPVYERKRLQLMTKLLDLQGDTRKEAPPRFDDDSEDDDEDEAGEAPAGQGSPTKRGSQSSMEEKREKRNSKLSDIKTRFDQPTSKGSYKYKTLEELKKEREMKKLGIKTESQDEEKEATPVAEEVPESPSSTPAHDAATTAPAPPVEEIEELKEEDEVEAGPSQDEHKETTGGGGTEQKKGRQKVASKFGKFFKGKGKDRSLSIPDNPGSSDNISQLSAENGSTTQIEEEPPSTEEPPRTGAEGDDQKPLTSMLERVTRRLGKYNYQKVRATLNGDTFHFAKPNKDKDGTTLSLVGAATAVRDSYQFELHTVDKSYTFRTDSEELCIKWVDSLKQAIEAFTPEPVEELAEENEEEPSPGGPAPIPQITVEEEVGGGTGGGGGGGGGGGEGAPNIKESLSYENFSFGGKKNKKQEMPDQNTVQMKGYLYKKGKFGWDKVWVVLTYDNTIFMSTNETTKKVSGIIPIGPESKVEEKKNPDKKYPHGLCVASGKSKETLATDSASDFKLWLTYLKQAAGGADIQELLSEDEEAGGELYEELELQDEPVPTIPVSPRPAHASFAPPPASAQDEELYDDFDGDIYEGLDELDVPQMPSPVKAPAIPSLPPRNEPKAPGPSLPPRNQPQQQDSPALPPRPSKGGGIPIAKTPLDYEAPAPSPPISKKGVVIPEPQPVDEELYDDVVGLQGGGGGETEEVEETYDDVVSTKAKILTSKVSAGELYEDMIPGAQDDGQEEYCDMIMPGQPVDDDLYVDVEADEPPPRPPPPTSTTPTNIPTRPPPPASSVTRPPPPKSSATTTKKPSDSPSLKTKMTSPTTSASPSNRITRPSPPATSSPTSVNPRRPGSASKGSAGNKVAHLSKMFGDAPSGESDTPKNKRGAMSGNLMYMGPGKTSYATDWLVLESTTLIFYKGPNEKLSHYRLSTKEAELHIESSDGKLGFHIKKGTIIHKFSASSLEEYGQWVGAIAHVITKVLPPPDSLYQAREDFKGKGNFEFKKDEVVWVLGEDTETSWMGVAGTSINDFREASGLFPSSKVGPLSQDESVYY